MTQVFTLSKGGLIPIRTDGLVIGQRVRQEYRYKVGTVCGKAANGYEVIFDDGDAVDGQQVGALSPYTRITVVDGMADSAEIERLRALRIIKREEDAKAYQAARQKLAQDTTDEITRLEKLYDWAVKPTAAMSGYARAAKNIKIELKRVFPHVKFSVSSKSYSGGNSISVRWLGGVTTDEVEAITSKYQDGYFDGSEDLYRHDNSAYGEAVSKVLGRARYVQTYRKFPKRYTSRLAAIFASYKALSIPDDRHETYADRTTIKTSTGTSGS